MTGFLSSTDLRHLTGAARRCGQVDWLRAWDSIDWNDDEEEDGLEGLLILPTATVLPASEPPPGIDQPVAGVYALFAENGALNYIGQSCDIGTRIAQHQRAVWRRERRPFTDYAYVELCEFFVDAVETAHIYALRPPENIKFDIARWEHHDEAVRLLRAAWGEKR